MAPISQPTFAPTNLSANIIPVGSALFEIGITATDPLNEIDLIDYAIPITDIAWISSVLVTCRTETKITIYNDLVLIGSGRTGPSCLNFLFTFDQYKEVNSGNIIIKCAAMSGRPATDIEAYLQGRLVTI